jgi:hypothetical protein
MKNSLQSWPWKPLAAGLWLGAWLVTWALQPEEIFRKASPAVWTVKGDQGNNKTSVGSAVAVTPAALATACHVVNGAMSATVTQGQATIKIKSILRDPDPSRDLCVLMTETPLQLPAVQIAPVEGLRVGQRVFAIGSPHGLELTLSEGSDLRIAAPLARPVADHPDLRAGVLGFQRRWAVRCRRPAGRRHRQRGARRREPRLCLSGAVGDGTAAARDRGDDEVARAAEERRRDARPRRRTHAFRPCRPGQ